MSTLEYYEKNGESYADSTLNADMSETYLHFLPLIKASGKILDLGCGSGRDSLAFIKQGFTVVAVDGSKQLCEYAGKLLNQKVRNISFNELDYEDEFDGVWACASLLHVPKNDIHLLLEKVYKSLKVGGVFYCSFKYGNTERENNGRFFSDYDESSINDIFLNDFNFSLIEYWLSFDVRKNRNNERWINIILKKN